MRTLVIATTNPGKLREIRELLAGLPVDLKTLADFPRSDPPEESGATFDENARQKAHAYARLIGHTVVAEDSGLEVDALCGEPGVQSARYGGENATYPEKFARLYAGLAEKGVSTGTARFVCALAVVDADEVLFEARGTIEGTIAPHPSGDGGFGYDPIFFYPPFGCTLAEVGANKGSVSHRGKAFRALKDWLETADPGRVHA